LEKPHLLQEDLGHADDTRYPRLCDGELRYAARCCGRIRDSGGGGDNAGTRYWGEYRHFQCVQCSAFQDAAVCGADRIVSFGRQSDGKPAKWRRANFVDWRDASRSFSGDGGGACGQFCHPASVLADRERRRGVERKALQFEVFFPCLGVQFHERRKFLPEQDRPGQNRSQHLGYRHWSERFGEDVDRGQDQFTLDDKSYKVVGVRVGGGGMPAGIFSSGARRRISRRAAKADIWVPMAPTSSKTATRRRICARHCRLKPGVKRQGQASWASRRRTSTAVT